MDDLRFFVLFNSVSVISGRWAVDNERLCAMELRLRLRRYCLERESNSVRQISRQALNPLSYRGPVHAGSRWFDSHRRHMSERFFSDPMDQCALSWKIVVSEWRSVIAVSLNVGNFIKLYQTGKTVHVHAKTLQTQRGRMHGAGCARPWFRTADSLGESRTCNENWITTKTTTTVHASSMTLHAILKKILGGQNMLSSPKNYLKIRQLLKFYFGLAFFQKPN